MATSRQQNLITSWLLWQFYEVPDFLIKVWQNYLLFGLNYFSILLLLKTIFSPWRGYNWKYPKALDVKEIFSTFISNVFSRVLGFVMRVVLIISGILVEIFIVFAGGALILFWILIPFIIIGGFLFVLTF